MAAHGILGGTFNPPHIGHLICAREAAWQLGLERVWLMPVAEPPHKEAQDDPGAVVRVEMCRLAVEGDDRLGVCSLEVERGGRSFTVDTLRDIHDAHPERELTFIVGGDQAHGFPGWREPEAILSLATLAVAERSGARREEVAERLASVPGGSGARVRFFDMPRLDVSSSGIRARVAAGGSIRYLVPDAVEELVVRRGLYRAAVSA